MPAVVDLLQVVRCPIRFARKFWVAHYLNAKLFQSEASAESVLNEIKTSQLYLARDDKLITALKLQAPLLQQWVRMSCSHDSNSNPRFQLFCKSIVDPSLDVNIADIPSNMEHIAARFTAIVKGGLASEEDQVRLKIACSAIKGALVGCPC